MRKLKKFIKFVELGMQQEVQDLLNDKNNTYLTLKSTSFMDSSGRQFKQVTPLQLSAYLLDWNMCDILLKNTLHKDAITQLTQLFEEGIEVKAPQSSVYEKTTQISWQNLIDHLTKIIDVYQLCKQPVSNSNEFIIREIYCKNVGAIQKLLPAHVIRACYFEPLKQLLPYSNNCFNNLWLNHGDALGNSFAWAGKYVLSAEPCLDRHSGHVDLEQALCCAREDIKKLTEMQEVANSKIQILRSLFIKQPLTYFVARWLVINNIENNSVTPNTVPKIDIERNENFQIAPITIKLR